MGPCLEDGDLQRLARLFLSAGFESVRSSLAASLGSKAADGLVNVTFYDSNVEAALGTLAAGKAYLHVHSQFTSNQTPRAAAGGHGHTTDSVVERELDKLRKSLDAMRNKPNDSRTPNDYRTPTKQTGEKRNFPP